MSYKIYYGTLNVKLSRNNKFIPMVLSGSNNVRVGRTRAREWSSVQDGEKLFFTPDEYMEYTRQTIENNKYLSDNRLYGKGNITPRKFINFAKKCIQYTISFEQARECGIQVVWWDKTKEFEYLTYSPKTEDELINFVNSDESKDKTLYIIFAQDYKANELYERLSTLSSFFSKKSEGKYCLNCSVKGENRHRQFIGKDDNNLPILVDSYDKAYRFENAFGNGKFAEALFKYIGNIDRCSLWSEEREKSRHK